MRRQGTAVQNTQTKNRTLNAAWQYSTAGKRKVLLSTLVGVSVVLATVTVASASRSEGRQPVASLQTTNQSVVWTVPANETSAPAVPTPGGAQLGAGAFNAVDCITSVDCVAVGGDQNLEGLASSTSDGGNTWTAATIESGQPELNAVSCASVSDCVAVGVGDSAFSTDGGNTWTSVSIPAAETALLSVSCASSTTCVSVGVSPTEAGPYSGQVLVSSDGGSTWIAPQLPPHVGALGSVDCPTETFCVAVGAEILVSNDGGQSWSPEFVNGGTGVLRNVSCSSSTNCVAVGPNGVGAGDPSAAAFAIETTDGGVTWSPITMPKGSFTVNTIECSSDSSCLASGPSTTQSVPLLASSDGGSTWKSESPISSVSAVASLSCQSSSDCVFVGVNGSTPVTGVTTNGSSWNTTQVGIGTTTSTVPQ
jgi:photosystem II stability/assembly factor-like uncharacterized protein